VLLGGSARDSLGNALPSLEAALGERLMKLDARERGLDPETVHVFEAARAVAARSRARRLGAAASATVHAGDLAGWRRAARVRALARLDSVMTSDAAVAEALARVAAVTRSRR
jgi:hypothetical protein